MFQDGSSRVCRSPQCLSLVKRLQTFSDPSADPCNSFYEAACGGWIKDQHRRHPDKDSRHRETEGRHRDNEGRHRDNEGLHSWSVLEQLRLEVDKRIRGNRVVVQINSIGHHILIRQISCRNFLYFFFTEFES